MPTMKKIALLAACAAALAACGCAGDKNKGKQKYLQSGRQYMQQQKYRQAAIQFRRALKLDPKFVDARYELAKAELAAGNLLLCAAAASDVIAVKPDHLDAHMMLARLYASNPNPESQKRAMEKVEYVLNADPKRLDAKHLLAQVSFLSRDAKRARELLRELVAADPKSAPYLVDLALAEAMLGESGAATDHLQQAIALNPRIPTAYIGLGRLYRAKQPALAEQCLRQGVDKNPAEFALYEELADLLYANGRAGEVNGVFATAFARAQKPAAVAASAGTYFVQRSDPGAAVAWYKRGLERDRENAELLNRLTDCYLGQNKIAEAEQVNREALRLAPKEVAGNVRRGRILMAQGKADQAVVSLRSAMKNSPKSLEIRYYLASACRQAGKLQEAKAELQNALSMAPDNALFEQSLVATYLLAGEFGAARDLAQTVIGREQEQPQPKIAVIAQMRRLLAAALVGLKDPNAARKELRTLQQMLPDDPAVELQMGWTYGNEQRWAEAEKAFASAAQMNPRDSRPITALADLKLQLKQYPQGIAMVQRFLEANPNDPDAHYALAGLLNASGQPEPAIREYERVLSLRPSSFAAQSQLGQLYERRGEIEPAITAYSKALELAPNSAEAHTRLAGMYAAKKDRAAARKHYEAALAIDPNFGPAANNLAWLMVQEGENLNVALTLAQKAAQNMSDSVPARDTLAWIQYRRGQYASAAELLKDCVQKAPTSPTYHYHYGLALHALKDSAGARRHFEMALKLNLTEAEARDARRLLLE